MDVESVSFPFLAASVKKGTLLLWESKVTYSFELMTVHVQVPCDMAGFLLRIKAVGKT
ncbi:hypothetical protein SLEP1_g8998 [Rubroshorea leprosula]|uniref:Uncharacterized protein n=1 Tax=Rubroshorea leprosula TaxID=152421 RepID=A0AAV5I9J6_9ROSI|nr:hypothetical protein SLEP1_g8998 [Rubroshorea leprosula]